MRLRSIRYVLACATLAAVACGSGTDTPSRSVEAVQHPPTGTAVRILPLGDSITEGSERAGSYRTWLRPALVEQGWDVDFVGSLRGYRDGPAAPGSDADHEGHWGWRVDQLARHSDRWLDVARPDVVLLHAGHNDLAHGDMPTAVAAEVVALARSITARREGAVVYVARIVRAESPDLDAAIAAMNEELAARLSALDDPRVRLVDLETGFDPSAMTSDGVHPNEVGARWMARRWSAALAGARGGTGVR